MRPPLSLFLPEVFCGAFAEIFPVAFGEVRGRGDPDLVGYFRITLSVPESREAARFSRAMRSSSLGE